MLQTAQAAAPLSPKTLSRSWGVSKLLNNPLFLLLGTGMGLAMITPLAKLALLAGINPFVWAALIAFLPGIVLWGFAARQGSFWRNSKLWRYGLMGGIAANLIPSSILLFAIPHIGSGLAGLMFALSPVVTATLSLILAVRPPNRPLLVAVALGFIGAVIVGSGRNALNLPEAPLWLLIALLVPCSLAIGNVYRTAKWPEGATPLQVAVVVNLSVVPIFVILAIWHGGSFWPVFDNLGLTLAQGLAALLNVGLFFRLQRISGPTYLSQIGYVAAAISLAIGTLYLGESYPWQVWLGASLIIAGIGASAWENLYRPKP
jgi:drug/metabolite transporter (DMT)-like permease